MVRARVSFITQDKCGLGRLRLAADGPGPGERQRRRGGELGSRFVGTWGLLHEYIGHDVSNMRGFDSYRLLTLSLAALMTRISSVVIEGAHTSAGAATLARTVPFWGRFRSPREPTAGPCRGCLLPSATNTAPSRHHLQAVLCDGWDVQTPPSWLLRPQTRELYGWS